MTINKLEDINVAAFDPMPTPRELHKRLPLSEKAAQTVAEGRASLNNILDRKDHRLLVVVGPCSIHDPVAGSIMQGASRPWQTRFPTPC